MAAASAVIGNSRWAQAHEGWREPPHLWACSVGGSGGAKSPGADPVLRGIVPALEADAQQGFPDTLREWQRAAEVVSPAVV
ncbi:MAG: DUF3987 domain-containing protein [Alphaproteobacteria bacterium]|nr:DUF3987 domain-containing protein [Alphaproteobacteria bacterium]